MFLGKLFLSMATVAAALFYLAGVFRPITHCDPISRRRRFRCAARAAAFAAAFPIAPHRRRQPLMSAHGLRGIALDGVGRDRAGSSGTPRVRRVEFDACGVAHRVRPTVQRWHG